MKRSRQNLFWLLPLILFLATCVDPRFTFGSERADDWVDLFGLGLVLLGGCLRVCARGWKYESGRRTLVTDGPYDYIRHPLYAASFLIGLGICTILGAPAFALAFLILFWASHLPVIRREEAKLARRFHDAYAAYREQVPALLPALGRLRKRRPIRPRGLLPALQREADAVCGWTLASLGLMIWQDLAAPAGRPRLTPEVEAMLVGALLLIVAWLCLRVSRFAESDPGAAPA